MILKFDLKLVVVDLMSHCRMWSKLNCFITSIVNWDISETQRKLYQIFYKGFNVKIKIKNKKFPTMFHKILMEKRICINEFASRILF